MEHQHPRPIANISKPGWIIAPLVVGNFLGLFMQAMLNSALPTIMREMQVGESTIQWLLTIFFLMSGIMVPVATFLMERFPLRRLFFLCSVFLLTGTLLCSVANSFTLLLIGRMIQTAGFGLIAPLHMTGILHVYPKEKHGIVLGVANLIFGLGPALGPAASGVIVQVFPWRGLFFFMLLLAALNTLLGAFAVRDVTSLRAVALDALSFVLSTLGFTGLLMGFSNAGQYGFGAAATLIPLGIGLVSLLGFISRQLSLSQPMLDFRVFEDARYLWVSVMGMVLFTCMAGSDLLLPLYLQTVRGAAPTQSGLIILPGALINGLVSPLVGKLYDRFGAKWLTRVGFMLLSAMAFVLANAGMQTPIALILFAYVLFMTGVGLLITTLTIFSMTRLPAQRLSHAFPMTITTRMIASAIGVAILITVMTARAGSAPTPDPSGMLEGIRAAFMLLAAGGALSLVISFLIGYKEEKGSA